MNHYERIVRECRIGIKALQNMQGSLSAVEKLCASVESKDSTLLASLFHLCVIKYAKPFLNSDSNAGPVRYPLRRLKGAPNFSEGMHDHLIEVRNTLIAHDDFEQVDPRILTLDAVMNGFAVPFSIAIANKCISHPADLEGAIKIKTHVAASVDVINKGLLDDLGRLRQARLDFPDEANAAAKYQRKHAPIDIAPGGSHVSIPPYTDDEYLNSTEPDFTAVHRGCRYEQFKLRRDFTEPQQISLPDGTVLVVTPPKPPTE